MIGGLGEKEEVLLLALYLTISDWIKQSDGV